MDAKAILTSHGIDEEAADKIAKAINKVVGDEFVTKDRYKDKLTEIATLQTDLKTAEDALSTAETWKSKYNDEVTAHNATRDGYAAEKDAADIDGKVTAALKAAGMNEKAIPKALKLYDRTIVEKDNDGNIKNTDKVLAHFKGEWGDFFGETQTKGAEVGNSPGKPPVTSWESQLKAARESKNMQEALRIKQEAYKEGVVLI